MYNSQNYIEKSLKLVSFDSLGHAVLHEQALALLQSFPKPISVMSIAGPFRSGKSYLLNCLISAESSFQVGSTTQSCTKGVWIWGKPLLSVDQSGKVTNILVIDTEGFGSCDQAYDKRIIILALLLSTCFIYNSKGLIDKQSLNDLNFVIQQTNKIKKELSLDSVTDFHWTLRDFHYELVNELGLKISPDQYMQKCLKQISSNNQQYKEMHKTLCSFFRNRSCHTFISPQSVEKNDQNPQFTQQLIKFKRILNRIPSINIDGQTLSEIISAYVEGMNENLTQDGVQREGMQCRMRINCMNELFNQFQTLREETNLQKREKLLEIVIKGVEQKFIQKMKSYKQINLLKQQMNLMVKQFNQNTHSSSVYPNKIESFSQTCKKQRRLVNLQKTKERNSNSFSDEKKYKQVICLAEIFQSLPKEDQKKESPQNLLQKIRSREELEGKAYRYQLEIEELTKQLIQQKQKSRILEQKNQSLSQQLSDCKYKIQEKQNAHRREIIEINQKMEKEAEEKWQQCSALEKEKLLYIQKIQFLEAKIAETELTLFEEKERACNKYKMSLCQLEKENKQIVSKYEKYLEQIKCIYGDSKELKFCQQQNNQKAMSWQQNEQIRIFMQKVSKLEEENEQHLIRKLQYENKIDDMQSKEEKLILQHKLQIENLMKKNKQKEERLQQVFQSQIANKQKLLQELEARYKLERNSLMDEIQILSKRSEMENLQDHQNVEYYESELRKLKEEILCVCEKLQNEQILKADKEREIKHLHQQIQSLRGQLSLGYNRNFQNQKLLKEENQNLIKVVSELKRQKIGLMEAEEGLRKEMKKQEQQFEQIHKKYRSFHELQICRLENKISSLTNANLGLIEAQNKYEEGKNLYELLFEQKLALEDDLVNKQKNLRAMQLRCEKLESKKQKLEETIKQLSSQALSIKNMREQQKSKSDEKIQEREQKYIQVLGEFHKKQMQLYVLSQRFEKFTKQSSLKEKQLNKMHSEICQEKNKQIQQLNNNNSKLSIKLAEAQAKLIKQNHELCLLNQRYGFIQQGYQEQLKNMKGSYDRDNQKNCVTIAQLEQQLKRGLEQKACVLKELQTLKHNQRETCHTLVEMRKKSDKYMEQYEVKIAQMREKMIELEDKNRQSKNKICKLEGQLRSINMNKQILEKNYNEDFRLWSTKFDLLRQNCEIVHGGKDIDR